MSRKNKDLPVNARTRDYSDDRIVTDVDHPNLSASDDAIAAIKGHIEKQDEEG
ncbi:hypothetical protein ACP26L_16605 [Paenibacillus sp. S-38]|uniref:hypothetical protein n=1 Tax=Paenibacillus sp. S-38 TaxID=3416710 RepID=UPI003CE9B07B